MNKMPQKIKTKLRQLQNVNMKAKMLDAEIEEMMKEYGVDPDDLRAMGEGEKQTEGLTFITYAEGYVEENIEEIEEVFLYYVNKEIGE